MCPLVFSVSLVALSCPRSPRLLCVSGFAHRVSSQKVMTRPFSVHASGEDFCLIISMAALVLAVTENMQLCTVVHP